MVRHDYRIGVPDVLGDPVAWAEVLNTDRARYGGSDIHSAGPLKPQSAGAHSRPSSILLTLPPLATVWLQPV
ncbi:alpha amylase C-terminal domain-containing protein [Streptomyces atratus]